MCTYFGGNIIAMITPSQPFIIVMFRLFVICMYLWHVFFYFKAVLGVWVKLRSVIQNYVVNYAYICLCNVIL